MHINTFQIITQSIGILGILSGMWAFQCKQYKWIMAFRTLNEFLFAIHYVLLGAYTGMTVNMIGCFRNLIFTNMIQKNKSTYFSQIIFSIIFLIFGIITWQGKASLLIIFAKITSTVAYSMSDGKKIRIIILMTSTCWLIYNVSVLSIAGVGCEGFTIISLIIGIIRIDIMPKFLNNDEK